MKKTRDFVIGVALAVFVANSAMLGVGLYYISGESRTLLQDVEHKSEKSNAVLEKIIEGMVLSDQGGLASRHSSSAVGILDENGNRSGNGCIIDPDGTVLTLLPHDSLAKNQRVVVCGRTSAGSDFKVPYHAPVWLGDSSEICTLVPADAITTKLLVLRVDNFFPNRMAKVSVDVMVPLLEVNGSVLLSIRTSIAARPAKEDFMLESLPIRFAAGSPVVSGTGELLGLVGNQRFIIPATKTQQEIQTEMPRMISVSASQLEELKSRRRTRPKADPAMHKAGLVSVSP